MRLDAFRHWARVSKGEETVRGFAIFEIEENGPRWLNEGQCTHKKMINTNFWADGILSHLLQSN
jgi:hypothetical protein